MQNSALQLPQSKRRRARRGPRSRRDRARLEHGRRRELRRLEGGVHVRGLLRTAFQRELKSERGLRADKLPRPRAAARAVLRQLHAGEVDERLQTSDMVRLVSIRVVFVWYS